MSHVTAISPQVFWPYFAAVALTLLAMVALARTLPSCRGWELLFALGPPCLAIPMAVFGAEHMSNAQVIKQIVPEWMPGRLFWTYFVGLCLIAAALSIVLRIQLRLSSLLLGSMLLAFVVLIHIPNALAKPGDRFRWIVAARDLSFACGALTLGIIEGKKTRFEEVFVLIMQFLIAVIAVFFGIESLQHPECVPGIPLAKLMPAWIPLGHLWTSLSGVALIACGVAMLLERTRQIAAAALGVLVLLLVLFLYVPMMIAKPDVESLNYVFDTLVYAGTLLIAASAVGLRIRSARDIRCSPATLSSHS